MKSYELCQCREPLQLRERPTPVPQGTEVLLRVLASGVCHSDLHFWGGTYDMGSGKTTTLQERGFKLPITMGHEVVGEVAAVGPTAHGTAVGSRRLATAWIGCGECAVCRTGSENLCLKPRYMGVYRDGGFASHVLVPHPRYLFDIGDLDPAAAAPLGCAGITTYSALKKFESGMLDQEPLVLIGAGGLGLMALALLRMMGHQGAYVLDIHPDKRQAALDHGALGAFDSSDPQLVEKLRDVTGSGPRAVLDLVGSSGTVQRGLDMLVKGGTLVIVGLYGGDVRIPTLHLPTRALTIRGSYLGSLDEMEALLQLARGQERGLLPVETRPLAQVNEALEDLREGRVIGRVVLQP